MTNETTNERLKADRSQTTIGVLAVLVFVLVVLFGVFSVSVGDAQSETDVSEIASCTEITDSGTYELASDIEATPPAVDTESGGACIRIAASDVVLEGNGNTVVGTEGDETIGILVANTEQTPAENVTVRNVRAERWGTGIQVGFDDASGEADLEDVTATENANYGVHVSYRGSASLEDIEANQNGGTGIEVSEGTADSIVDVTVTENGEDGLTVSEGAANLIGNVTANSNGESGLYLYDTREITVERLTAANNTDNGIDFSADVYSSEFSEVYVSNNSRRGVSLVGDSSNNRFQNSTIEENGGPGIIHVDSDGNEFQNVTLRDNQGPQIEPGEYNMRNNRQTFTAEDLQIDDAVTVNFEEEAVSIDDVEPDELANLPSDAEPLGDGIEIEGLNGSADVTLESDQGVSGNEPEELELYRRAGTEWVPVEDSVTVASNSIDASLSQGGVYAPVQTTTSGDTSDDQTDEGPTDEAPTDEDQTDEDQTDEDQTDQIVDGGTLEVIAGQEPDFDYRITVEGDASGTSSGGVAADDDDRVIEHNDGTTTILGSTGSLAGDAFDIDGSVVAFVTPGNPDYELQLDGVDVTDQVNDDASTFNIIAEQEADFEFRVTVEGDAWKTSTQSPDHSADSEESITTLADGTTVVTGSTGGRAGDAFTVDGTITSVDIAADAEYRLVLDGEEIEPDELPE